MTKSQKANRLIWTLSLTLGPVLYCVLLMTLPGMSNIEVIETNIIDLVVTFAICWALCFVFVLVWYWLGKFVIKYGPFL